MSESVIAATVPCKSQGRKEDITKKAIPDEDVGMATNPCHPCYMQPWPSSQVEEDVDTAASVWFHPLTASVVGHWEAHVPRPILLSTTDALFILP